MPRKIIAFIICFCLIFEQAGFAQVAPQLGVPVYLQNLAPVADKFRPIHLRSLSIDPATNNLNLLLDKGDTRQLQKPQVEETTKKLLEYFKIGLTLPNSMFWVNLRPDSPNNVIDPYVEQTDLGKVLLEADLQLKKDMARLTSPNTPEGRQYWDKLYQKADSLYGGQNMEIPTLTRPWIVPGEIIIGESKDSAYVYKATLKVMLEQDYLKDTTFYSFDDDRAKQLNDYSSKILRDIIIPKLTREVNASKRYAGLRQVFYSLVMAQWFKRRVASLRGAEATKQSLSGSELIKKIDTKDLSGLTSKVAWSKDAYYKAYQKSFKNGEYNQQETVYSPYGETIRSYFSGGIVVDGAVRSYGGGTVVSTFIPPATFGVSVMVSNNGGIKVEGPLDNNRQEPAAPATSQQLPAQSQKDGGMLLSLAVSATQVFALVAPAYLGWILLTVEGPAHFESVFDDFRLRVFSLLLSGPEKLAKQKGVRGFVSFRTQYLGKRLKNPSQAFALLKLLKQMYSPARDRTVENIGSVNLIIPLAYVYKFALTEHIGELIKQTEAFIESILNNFPDEDFMNNADPLFSDLDYEETVSFLMALADSSETYDIGIKEMLFRNLLKLLSVTQNRALAKKISFFVQEKINFGSPLAPFIISKLAKEPAKYSQTLDLGSVLMPQLRKTADEKTRRDIVKALIFLGARDNVPGDRIHTLKWLTDVLEEEARKKEDRDMGLITTLAEELAAFAATGENQEARALIKESLVSVFRESSHDQIRAAIGRAIGFYLLPELYAQKNPLREDKDILRGLAKKLSEYSGHEKYGDAFLIRTATFLYGQQNSTLGSLKLEMLVKLSRLFRDSSEQAIGKILDYENRNIGRDKQLEFYRNLNHVLAVLYHTDLSLKILDDLLNDYFEKFGYFANRDMILLYNRLKSNSEEAEIDRLLVKYNEIRKMVLENMDLRGVDLNEPITKAFLEHIFYFSLTQWSGVSSMQEIIRSHYGEQKFLDTLKNKLRYTSLERKSGSFDVRAKAGDVVFDLKTIALWKRWHAVGREAMSLSQSIVVADILQEIKKQIKDIVDEEIKKIGDIDASRIPEKARAVTLEGYRRQRESLEKIRDGLGNIKPNMRTKPKVLVELVKLVVTSMNGQNFTKVEHLKRLQEPIILALVSQAIWERKERRSVLPSALIENEQATMEGISQIVELRNDFIKYHILASFDDALKNQTLKALEINPFLNKIREENSRFQEDDKMAVNTVFTKGVIGEFSGYIGDACYTAMRNIMRYPAMVGAIIFKTGEGMNERIMGSMLILENTVDGEPVWVLRAINPREEFLADYSPRDFLQGSIRIAEGLAKERGVNKVLVASEYGAISNRMGIYMALKEFTVSGPKTLQKKEAFNSHDITSSVVEVKSTKDDAEKVEKSQESRDPAKRDGGIIDEAIKNGTAVVIVAQGMSMTVFPKSREGKFVIGNDENGNKVTFLMEEPKSMDDLVFPEGCVIIAGVPKIKLPAELSSTEKAAFVPRGTITEIVEPLVDYLVKDPSILVDWYRDILKSNNLSVDDFKKRFISFFEEQYIVLPDLDSDAKLFRVENAGIYIFNTNVGQVQDNTVNLGSSLPNEINRNIELYFQDNQVVQIVNQKYAVGLARLTAMQEDRGERLKLLNKMQPDPRECATVILKELGLPSRLTMYRDMNHQEFLINDDKIYIESLFGIAVDAIVLVGRGDGSKGQFTKKPLLNEEGLKEILLQMKAYLMRKAEISELDIISHSGAAAGAKKDGAFTVTHIGGEAPDVTLYTSIAAEKNRENEEFMRIRKAVNADVLRGALNDVQASPIVLANSRELSGILGKYSNSLLGLTSFEGVVVWKGTMDAQGRIIGLGDESAANIDESDEEKIVFYFSVNIYTGEVELRGLEGSSENWEEAIKIMEASMHEANRLILIEKSRIYDFGKDEVDDLRNKSQGFMTMEEFIVRHSTDVAQGNGYVLSRSHLLLKSAEDARYKRIAFNFFKIFGLVNYNIGYIEQELVSSQYESMRPQTEEYMNRIVNSGQPIVFFVPQYDESMGGWGEARNEMNWFLANRGNPLVKKNVYFVFGIHDWVSDASKKDKILDTDQIMGIMQSRVSEILSKNGIKDTLQQNQARMEERAARAREPGMREQAVVMFLARALMEKHPMLDTYDAWDAAKQVLNNEDISDPKIKTLVGDADLKTLTTEAQKKSQELFERNAASRLAAADKAEMQKDGGVITDNATIEAWAGKAREMQNMADALRSYLEGQKPQIESIDPDLARYISRIVEQTYRINDIFRRLQVPIKDSPEAIEQNIPLKEVAQRILKEESSHPNADTLTLRPVGGKEVQVDTYLRILEDAMRELIRNAIKRTAQGGEVSIETVPLSTGRVQIVVTNDAVIPIEYRPRIFDLTEADRAKLIGSGRMDTGQGLHEIRQNLESYLGGSIELRSDDRAKRTSFIVEIPATLQKGQLDKADQERLRLRRETHAIRNILTVVTGYLDLSVEKAPSDIKERLEPLIISTKNLDKNMVDAYRAGKTQEEQKDGGSDLKMIWENLRDARKKELVTIMEGIMRGEIENGNHLLIEVEDGNKTVKVELQFDFKQRKLTISDLQLDPMTNTWIKSASKTKTYYLTHKRRGTLLLGNFNLLAKYGPGNDDTPLDEPLSGFLARKLNLNEELLKKLSLEAGFIVTQEPQTGQYDLVHVPVKRGVTFTFDDSGALSRYDWIEPLNNIKANVIGLVSEAHFHPPEEGSEEVSLKDIMVMVSRARINKMVIPEIIVTAEDMVDKERIIVEEAFPRIKKLLVLTKYTFDYDELDAIENALKKLGLVPDEELREEILEKYISFQRVETKMQITLPGLDYVDKDKKIDPFKRIFAALRGKEDDFELTRGFKRSLFEIKTTRSSADSFYRTKASDNFKKLLERVKKDYPGAFPEISRALQQYARDLDNVNERASQEIRKLLESSDSQNQDSINSNRDGGNFVKEGNYIIGQNRRAAELIIKDPLTGEELTRAQIYSLGFLDRLAIVRIVLSEQKQKEKEEIIIENNRQIFEETIKVAVNFRQSGNLNVNNILDSARYIKLEDLVLNNIVIMGGSFDGKEVNRIIESIDEYGKITYRAHTFDVSDSINNLLRIKRINGKEDYNYFKANFMNIVAAAKKDLRYNGGPQSTLDRFDGGNLQQESTGKGGIDLREMPIVTKPIETLAAPNSLNAPTAIDPKVAEVLNKQWAVIQQQMSQGQMPYKQMKEYVVSCNKERALEQINQMCACIANILRLEEDAAVATPHELKEILTTIG